jgi:hypothetical protein
MIKLNLFDKDKKKSSFTILGKESTTEHKGYGAGVLSLSNISPVIVDLEEEKVYIEMGALHARSDIEKGIKFLPNREEVPNGKPYWLVWVTSDNKEDGSYYAGVTACELTVDREIRRGYKNLPEHVNRMDKSLKRKIIIDHMDEPSRILLKDFLKNHNEDMWNRSDQELREA